MADSDGPEVAVAVVIVKSLFSCSSKSVIFGKLVCIGGTWELIWGERFNDRFFVFLNLLRALLLDAERLEACSGDDEEEGKEKEKELVEFKRVDGCGDEFFVLFLDSWGVWWRWWILWRWLFVVLELLIGCIIMWNNNNNKLQCESSQKKKNNDNKISSCSQLSELKSKTYVQLVRKKLYSQSKESTIAMLRRMQNRLVDGGVEERARVSEESQMLTNWDRLDN